MAKERRKRALLPEAVGGGFNNFVSFDPLFEKRKRRGSQVRKEEVTEEGERGRGNVKSP